MQSLTSAKPSLRKFAAISSTAIGLALGASLLGSPAEARDLCNNFNTDGVANPPLAQTYCLLPGASGQVTTYHVSQLVTYHYNRGRGAAPGTISLRGSNGRIYTFAAHDDAGRRGVPSYNWIAEVNLDLPADNYAVIDSDWGSWSTNGRARGWGFAIVRGDIKSVSAAPPAPRPSAVPVVATGFSPLANGPFCLHPYQPGAWADTYPCTGPTRAGTMVIDVRLRRAVPRPLSGAVVYTLAGTSAYQVFSGAILSGGGTTVNSDYAVQVPAALCAHPNAYYSITLPGYGAIGQFVADCR